ITGFSRDSADFDRPVGNLAHFQFKKAAHKIWMAARDDDFRTAQSVFNGHNIRAETIADVVIFNNHSFTLRHDRLKFSKIENHIRTIEPAHSAADDLARAIFELLINHFLLDLANALHHRLLGSLRSDAAEIFWRDFYVDRLAN